MLGNFVLGQFCDVTKMVITHMKINQILLQAKYWSKKF
jgi:hypothetical protein